VAPPRAAVVDVEVELLQLMEKISKDEKAKRNKLPSLTSASKVLEEVVEEVVSFEPWMDDYGRELSGVEFAADDQLCTQHPEVWLAPNVIRDAKDAEEAVRKQKKSAADKKEAKRKEKKLQDEVTTQIKKGIASKKNTIAEVVDDVHHAAASMLADDNNYIDDVDEDFFDDLGLIDEDVNYDDLT
jgi:hypothetical protein